MLKRIFRRRRTTSATPLRVALHGTAISLSSAGFGYGTTFIGADAPSAAGLGLSVFTVLLTLFPLPSRKDTGTPEVRSEVPERTSGAAEQGKAEWNDTLPIGPQGSSSMSTASGANPVLTSDGEEPLLSAVDTEPTVPAIDAEPKPANRDEKRSLLAADPTAPEGTSPISGMQREPNVPVLVWEPRLEIKPRVTVHPTVFTDASGTGTVSALPTIEPDEGLTLSDEAS